MASPQTENGFTKIANELLIALARHNLSPYEFRVLMAVIRKTYGWSKKEDFISVSQIQEITNLDRRNVSRAKKSLIKKKILIITDKTMLAFNKNYDDWLSSSKTIGAIVYRDTRPQWFPPPGYPYKKSSNALCEMCFGEFDFHKNEFNNHHIVPKSRGGIDRKENWINVCIDCHEKIHDEFNKLGIVSIDDMQHYYRQFMSKVSSAQTLFLSSHKTPQKKVIKDTITKEIIYMWNSFAKDNDLSSVLDIKKYSTRERNLKTRIKENNLNFQELLKKIKRQPFLLGENDKGWRITFDWVLLPSNYIKIMEEQYKDRSQKFGSDDWAKERKGNSEAI